MTFDPGSVQPRHLVRRKVSNPIFTVDGRLLEAENSSTSELVSLSIGVENGGAPFSGYTSAEPRPISSKAQIILIANMVLGRARWRTNVLLLLVVFLAGYIIVTNSRSGKDNSGLEIDISEIEREIDSQQADVRTVTYKSIFQDLFDKLPQAPAQPDQQQQQQQRPKKRKDYRSLEFEKGMRYHHIWDWAANAISSTELWPEVPEVDEVLHALETARIVNVDVLDIGSYESGTSEKWVVMLEGGQKAMMKIVWENKGKGKYQARCNNGFEIPTAEIAAFHFHRLLGFRNTPYVTGRKVDLKREILPAASPTVAKQIVKEANKTCVVGKCYFCKHHHTYCPEDGIMEVSISYWVPRHLRLHTYPPRYMPYSTPNMKQWGDAGFNNKTYCKWTQRNQSPYEKLKYYYDLFDFGVLDTIMYHYDSKHYTIEDNTEQRGLTVRLDHGRSFCSNDRDDDHIFLAPVTQCCTLRKSTWHKLESIRGGLLTTRLRAALDKDPIAPGVLEEKWYPVMERRLKIVMEMVERCAEANGWDNVLVGDDG